MALILSFLAEDVPEIGAGTDAAGAVGGGPRDPVYLVWHQHA